MIDFSGFRWIPRHTERPAGPGPNRFDGGNVRLEKDGLHFAVTGPGGEWRCAQAHISESLGYGRYLFYVRGRIDRMDENIVLGLFTWDDRAIDLAYREIDIEITRWGVPSNPCGWYTVQPSRDSSSESFDFKLGGTNTTHSFEWRPSGIFFESYHGHHRVPPDKSHVIRSWIYRGDIFPPGNEKVAVNLWLMKGRPPKNGRSEEIILTGFEFFR